MGIRPNRVPMCECDAWTKELIREILYCWDWPYNYIHGAIRRGCYLMSWQL